MTDKSSTEAEWRDKEAFHRHLAGEIVAELPYRPEDQRHVLSLVLQLLKIPVKIRTAFDGYCDEAIAAADNVVRLRQLNDGSPAGPKSHASRSMEKRRRHSFADSFSEKNFRLLADNAPVMIWRSGTGKLCDWFNKPWLDFTGRTLEQELGNGWTQGVHKDDFDRCLRTYVSAFDRRENFSMDYRLRRHDGVYRWILDNGQPYFSRSGRFRGYFGSAIDIHDRKQAEAEMRSRASGEGASLVTDDEAEIDYGGLVPERLDGPLMKVVDDGDDLHFIYRDRHLVRSKADFALTRLRVSAALQKKEVGVWPDLRGFKRERAM
jgi:PAS domain S-box-containing protein